MVIVPALHEGGGGDGTPAHRGVLAWRWDAPVAVLSSASVGGGLAQPDWLINIGVPLEFQHTGLVAHATRIAASLELGGGGVALFTAANVALVQRGECEGVAVDATVGLSKPTWAADPGGGFSEWRPGTINIVIQLPVGLDHGAAVNAVITATEAKTQALQECGVPGTGTASDAIAVVWPSDVANEPFAGPRSLWGARVAQATHAAVRAGVDGGPR